MDLTRRNVLGAVAAGVAAGLPLPRWPLGEHLIEREKRGARLMGDPTPVGQLGVVLRGLSDDVFDRAQQATTGQQFYVTDCVRVGSAQDGYAMAAQECTGFKLDPKYLSPEPPVFDLEVFRLQTDRWSRVRLDVGHGEPLQSLMARSRAVGRPYLPHGTLWATHYLSERSGLVMRAVAIFDIVTDFIVVRWDVLHG